MLDADSWRRLIDGLNEATRRGRIEWEAAEKNSKSATLGSLVLRSRADGSVRVFTARAGSTIYELTSEDPRGLAPFELLVRELRGTQFRQVGRLESSTEVADNSVAELNSSLAYLFKTVSSTIETPDEVVTRLLRGLGL